MSSNIREKIKKHLKMCYQVHDIGKNIKDANNDSVEVTQTHNIDINILKKRIIMIRKQMEYLIEKINFETAIHDIVYSKTPLEENAIANKLDHTKLFTECMNYMQLRIEEKTYIYDKISEEDGVFTFIEQSSLLEQLRSWATEENCQCCCQVCAMEQLQIIAYNFAKLRKHLDEIPKEWLGGKTDFSWLSDFILEYIEKISKYKTADECRIDSKTPRQLTTSLSFDQQEMSSISQDLQKDSKSSRPFIGEKKKIDIRKEIADHLRISKILNEAVQNVNNKETNISHVARKFKVSPYSLRKKYEILKAKTSYFKLKCKMEKAIYDIKINGIALSDAAKEHGLEERVLQNEIEGNIFQAQFGIYVYDALTIDKGIFTFSEEFMLLNQLNNLKETLSCQCRICALECLSKLAYKRVHHSSDYTDDANERMNITWIREFEMRHSTDIFNNFNRTCSMEKKLRKKSASQYEISSYT